MTPHRKWLQARLKEPNERISKAAENSAILWYFPAEYLRSVDIREQAIKRFKWL